MFGLVISGRPVNAEPSLVSQSETQAQYAFRIPSIPQFSHMTVFILPGQVLPADVGATVWIRLPQSQEFKLLGALSMQKQSAIFKISGVGNTGAHGGVVAGGDDEMVDEGAAGAPAVTDGGDVIDIGISIEPAAVVEQNLATLLPAQTNNPTSALVRQPAPVAPVNQVTTKLLAQRIIGNAFNFLTSFGDGQTVPMKAFQDWWNKFEKKIELDPTFLERAET